MTAALELQSGCVRFGDADALANACLSLGERETLVVLGTSGSGKTTLLRALLGLIPLDSGTVTVRGKLATRGTEIAMPAHERGLAVVFQDLALWPHMTVEQHLDFVLHARDVTRDERADRIARMLEQVSLGAKRARKPSSLSGGERQRVALARALVVEPTAVLLDEPLANVDVVLKQEMLALMRDLFDARGTPALHVSHDAREADGLERGASISPRVAVMHRGRVVQSGTLAQLRDAPLDELTRKLVSG